MDHKPANLPTSRADRIQDEAYVNKDGNIVFYRSSRLVCCHGTHGCGICLRVSNCQHDLKGQLWWPYSFPLALNSLPFFSAFLFLLFP